MTEAKLRGRAANYASTEQQAADRAAFLKARTAGGRVIADGVKGTARQKVKILEGSKVARAAVLEFGTRRQKRAAQRAEARLAKRQASTRVDT